MVNTFNLKNDIFIFMKVLLTESQFIKLLEDIEPSDAAIKNICDSEKFCKAQGQITFGQLKAIVDSATKKRIFTNLGEGGYKATLRLLPWFLPQLMLAGAAASITRAINKIIRPALEDTQTYKTWWGKAVIKSFNIAEGEINLKDPLSKIFFISEYVSSHLPHLWSTPEFPLVSLLHIQWDHHANFLFLYCCMT